MTHIFLLILFFSSGCYLNRYDLVFERKLIFNRCMDQAPRQTEMTATITRDCIKASEVWNPCGKVDCKAVMSKSELQGE